MSALAQQQQALLQALWTRPGQAPPDSPALVALLAAPWQRGLAAYRTNAGALAERALQAAYPVVAELIGGDSFALMARQFWLRHPPERGDLACWGEALPGFLARDPQLANVPYLADVARLEWALHCNAGAPDAAPLEPASFALLGQQAPDVLTLRLPPGTVLQRSRWPVVSLVNVHLLGDPGFDTVAARVQARQGEAALVWRQGLRPCLMACTPAEAALVEALLAGQSLLAALDAALAAQAVDAARAQQAAFDFSAWLNAAVTQGLVLGACWRVTAQPQENALPPSARPGDPSG